MIRSRVSFARLAKFDSPLFSVRPALPWLAFWPKNGTVPDRSVNAMLDALQGGEFHVAVDRLEAVEHVLGEDSVRVEVDGFHQAVLDALELAGLVDH